MNKARNRLVEANSCATLEDADWVAISVIFITHNFLIYTVRNGARLAHQLDLRFFDIENCRQLEHQSSMESGSSTVSTVISCSWDLGSRI